MTAPELRERYGAIHYETQRANQRDGAIGNGSVSEFRVVGPLVFGRVLSRDSLEWGEWHLVAVTSSPVRYLRSVATPEDIIPNWIRYGQ